LATLVNFSLIKENNYLQERNQMLIIYNNQKAEAIEYYKKENAELKATSDGLMLTLYETEKLVKEYEDKLYIYENSPDFNITEPIVSDDEIIMIAQTVWGEARGMDKYHQSMVVWCILNRVDTGRWGNRVAGVIKAENQFIGYSNNNPVEEQFVILAKDIIARWRLEKLSGYEVGRTLPKHIVNFHAGGGYNQFYFTNKYGKTEYYAWQDKYNPYNTASE
jgi:hypothetical protein